MTSDILDATTHQKQDPPDQITIDHTIHDPKFREYIAMLSTIQEHNDGTHCKGNDIHLEEDALKYHDPDNEQSNDIGEEVQLTLDLDAALAVANVLDNRPKLENKFLRTAPNPETLRKLQPFLIYCPVDAIKHTL